MTDDNNTLTVQILGKNFTLKVPTVQAQDLEYTVKYLNDTVLDIRQNTGVVGYENLITLAALNIANELLNPKDGNKESLFKITKKIDEITLKLKHKISQERITEL